MIFNGCVVYIREITAILYLTPPDPPWRASMGGALRLFVGAAVTDNSGESCTEPPVELLPATGRLVLFQSRTMLHEVLRVHGGGRTALSCWLLCDPLSKLDFLNKR